MKQINLSLLALAIASSFGVQAEESSSSKNVKTPIEVIVISGSRMEQKIEQVAGSITVIDESAISKSQSNDFSGLFRNESAIGVKGGAGKPTTVTIRGIGGNRVMMVKDGVRVNNQYASPLGPGAEGTGRGLTEVQSLKQVEVVKAAASTMYGSDALGGVVVMRTKDASDYLSGEDHYLSMNTGYTGINNEYTAGLTTAQGYGNFESLFSYQHRKGEETKNYQDNLPKSDLTQDSFLLKSKYHFNDHTWLQLTLDYLEQDLARFEQKLDRNLVPKEEIDTNKTSKVFNGALQLRSDKPTLMHDNLTVTVYTGSTKQQEYRNYFDINTDLSRTNSEWRDYQFDDQRIGVNSTFNKYIGNDNYGHELTYGVDYEWSKMSRNRIYAEPITNPKEQFTFADTESQRMGIFAQDDVTLMDGKLNIIAGIRYDYYENTPDKSTLTAAQNPANFEAMNEGFWSPKVGMVYHLADAVSVYGQYTYGYKMPTPDQKWGELTVNESSMPLDVLIKPNYELEAEYSDTFELGVRGNHINTRYELTAFYSKVKDYIDWEFLKVENIDIPMVGPHTTNLQYRYFNREEVTLYGFEAQLNQWVTDDIEVWGNLSYTHGEDEKGNYLNTISPMRGTVGANYYTHLAAMETDFGLVVRFADKMDRTTNLDVVVGNICMYGVCVPSDSFNTVYNTAGYAVVDLTMSMYINESWTVRSGVYNLLDKEYIDYADVAGQSKFLLNSLGTPDSNFTQPGRYFNLSVNYQF